jgi:NitT/TauT family transport system substrate-binding protein
MDANLKLQVLMDKKADAIVGWVNYQIPQLEVKGFEVNSMMLSDYGINSMSLVVMASRKTIESNPEMVKRFVAGTVKGLEYAKSHPEESIALLRQQFPNLDERIGLKQLLATFPLAHTRNTEGKPLGWMALKDWEDTQELLIKFAGMKDKADPASAYTNQFIQ